MKQKTFWKPTKMKVTVFKSTKKYGDRDLDGSMNYTDCDPRRADRDGLLGLAVGKVTKGLYGQTKTEFIAERKEKQKLTQKRRMERIKAGMKYAKEEAELKRKRRLMKKKKLLATLAKPATIGKRRKAKRRYLL